MTPIILQKYLPKPMTARQASGGSGQGKRFSRLETIDHFLKQKHSKIPATGRI
jgi:hypothetical protein